MSGKRPYHGLSLEDEKTSYTGEKTYANQILTKD
jgi:hypothetical protein